MRARTACNRTSRRVALAAVVLAVLGAAGPADAYDGEHQVRSGETVSEIAAANGTTVAAVVAANRLGDADHIVVGQVLVIPGGDAGGAGDRRPRRGAGRDPRAHRPPVRHDGVGAGVGERHLEPELRPHRHPAHRARGQRRRCARGGNAHGGCGREPRSDRPAVRHVDRRHRLGQQHLEPERHPDRSGPDRDAGIGRRWWRRVSWHQRLRRDGRRRRPHGRRRHPHRRLRRHAGRHRPPLRRGLGRPRSRQRPPASPHRLRPGPLPPRCRQPAADRPVDLPGAWRHVRQRLGLPPLGRPGPRGQRPLRLPRHAGPGARVRDGVLRHRARSAGASSAWPATTGPSTSAATSTPSATPGGSRPATPSATSATRATPPAAGPTSTSRSIPTPAWP